VYGPKDVNVPGFLPDIPDVRKEVAQYCCSARRCDDTVGAVLRALKESGQDGNTLVMFLSDNGMSFPFSKTNCYFNSTRTPWIVRWPGRVKPGTVESQDFISGIDYMPTILDALSLPQPKGMDGESFMSLLGIPPGIDTWRDASARRDRVFTVFHETSGKNRYEMRCVQNARLGYIYNAWSDGKTIFKNESQGGLTMAAMREAAKSDKEIAARVKLFLYRVPEELYDFEQDPDALHNLVDDPNYRADLTRMRKELLDWMKRTGDPIVEKYRGVVG
jgi:N-sulfoglucosamine sulfohydrolase